MTDIIPCLKKGRATIAFFVGEDETHAFILDNYVWAVHVKPFPIEEWHANWKRVVVNEDKLQKILTGLANYAVFAGMTPEAAQYLPNMIPMSKEAQRIAIDKGYATLERYKTQAAAEEAMDKVRPLAGAPLASVVKKALGEAEREAQVEARTIPLADKPKRQRPAAKARDLAHQVSDDLKAAEAAGEDPTKVLKAPSRAKGFSAATLKDADGEYKSVSAMLKGLILENETRKKPRTDDEIFQLTKAKFGLDDGKRGYVGWNRNWLQKEGHLPR